eukprot:4970940-Alexandrium_andersonii.AAC.1
MGYARDTGCRPCRRARHTLRCHFACTRSVAELLVKQPCTSEQSCRRRPLLASAPALSGARAAWKLMECGV